MDQIAKSPHADRPSAVPVPADPPEVRVSAG